MNIITDFIIPVTIKYFHNETFSQYKKYIVAQYSHYNLENVLNCFPGLAGEDLLTTHPHRLQAHRYFIAISMEYVQMNCII